MKLKHTDKLRKNASLSSLAEALRKDALWHKGQARAATERSRKEPEQSWELSCASERSWQASNALFTISNHITRELRENN